MVRGSTGRAEGKKNSKKKNGVKSGKECQEYGKSEVTDCIYEFRNSESVTGTKKVRIGKSENRKNVRNVRNSEFRG